MNFLIGTSDNTILKESTLIIEKELPLVKSIQDALSSSELNTKIGKTKFEYILIDLNSCPIDEWLFEKLTKLKDTKVKITAKNFGDIPIDFFNQKSIQLCSINFQALDQELKKIILNNKGFIWGEEVSQVSLYKDEVLCHKGSIGDAIYLIKEGALQRKFPDGKVLDDSIGKGHLVGELAYFNRGPRKWSVVAKENCKLVRIDYNKIDKQLEDQPAWLKAMLVSLAERSLKYAK